MPGMLFTNRATTSMTAAPAATGRSTYRNPRAWIFELPMTAIRAVAPPGGCSVLVTCMAAIAVPTANGADAEEAPDP